MAEPGKGITLVCSGMHRPAGSQRTGTYFRGKCFGVAVWACTVGDSGVWRGACGHHLNTVARLLAGEAGRAVTIQLAKGMEFTAISDAKVHC